MTAAASFRSFAGVLALAIGLLPMAPPEHLHESTDHGGHHEEVAHRHDLLHVSDLAGPHNEHGVEIEDPDAHGAVITIDPVSESAAPPFSLVAPIPHALDLPEPPAPQLRAPVASVEPLIHGPPRAPAALRGPPSSFSI